MQIKNIDGDCVAAMEPLAEAFARTLDLESELGGAFSVFKGDQPLIDVWGGHADAARQISWKRDTMVNVWSCTKGMQALCVARLTDQGLLDVRRPVADYWPEFAANGKQTITVAEMFSHQAGLCGPTHPMKEDDYYDVDAVADLLAAQAPHRPAEPRSAYHGLTIGYLGHGLIRRLTGKSVGEYFRDEIAAPANVDFHMGVTAAEKPRIAEIAHDGQPLSGGEETYNEYQRIGLVHMRTRAGIANDPRWQAMGIASAGGTGNARALARVYGALTTARRLGDLELVSERALADATTPQIENEDLVLRWPITWGVGFALNKGMWAYGPNPRTFGHHGWGGAFAFGDPDLGIGVAYTMNYMREPVGGPDPRFASLVSTLYECV